MFSNGLLDPWSTGGFMESPSPSLPVVLVKDAGHHMDLFFSNPADTQSVLDARKTEIQAIRDWLAQP